MMLAIVKSHCIGLFSPYIICQKAFLFIVSCFLFVYLLPLSIMTLLANDMEKSHAAITNPAQPSPRTRTREAPLLWTRKCDNASVLAEMKRVCSRFLLVSLALLESPVHSRDAPGARPGRLGVAIPLPVLFANKVYYESSRIF